MNTKPKKRKGRVVAKRTPNFTRDLESDGYVFILPANAASVERMVEQAEAKINALMLREKDWSIEDIARFALAAIGIRAQ